MEKLGENEELFVLTNAEFLDVYRYLPMVAFYKEGKNGEMLVKTSSVKLKAFLKEYLQDKKKK